MIPSFIKTTVKFLVGCTILIVGVFFISHLMVRKYSSFELPATTKHLILGHSHPECAFDDSQLENFQNLAKGGEAYLYTYYKLREVLPENPQIESIWIEYSNSTISPAMDQWTWGFEKLNAFYPRHAPFMDFTDVKFLYEKNKSDFLAVNSTSARINLLKVLRNDLSVSGDFGSFVPLDRSMSTIQDTLVPSILETGLRDSVILSQTNLSFLDSIILLCDSYHVKVVLVRSPQHPSFNRYNEEELHKLHKTRYKSSPFLDFNRAVVDSKHYGDPGHLNASGARRFTAYLKESMDSLNTVINQMQAIKPVD